MARETKQYDPGQVIFNVNGRDVSGYAAGSFIEVERNKDAFTLVVGSDGEHTRVKSQDRSGIFKCTLQQSSPLNDYFTSLANQDELTSNAAVPIFLKDANGTTIAQAQKGWVKKKASSTYGDNVENREWTFETGNLNYTVGGENAL